MTTDEEMRLVIESYANEYSRAPKTFMKEFDRWLKEHDKSLESAIDWEYSIGLKKVKVIKGENK